MKLRVTLEKTNSNSTLHLINVNDDDFKQFHGFWENHGRQVFYRFVIPGYIPISFKYIIYMDVDMIVYDTFDFTELELSNTPIGAVKDHISNVLAPKRGLKEYFNSGFLVIDRKYWIDNNVTKTLFKLNPPKRRFADQDILNEMFKNNWKQYSNKYNFPASKLKHLIFGYRIGGIGKPIVIHFNGGIKPWNYWQVGSWLYWKFILKSPLKKNAIKAPISIYKSLEYKLLKLFNL